MANEKSKLKSLGKYQRAGGSGPKYSERCERGRADPGCGAADDRSKRGKGKGCGQREQRLALHSLAKDRKPEHPSCKQRPGPGDTHVSDLQLHLLQGVHGWVVASARTPPAQTHWHAEGRRRGARRRRRGRRRRRRSPKLLRVSHGAGSGDAGRTKQPNPHTNCLSTARAQSPQAPPPPTRGPAPSSPGSPPRTARTFHFSRQPIRCQSQSSSPPFLRTSRVGTGERWSWTLQLPECRAKRPGFMLPMRMRKAGRAGLGGEPLPHTRFLDEEDGWEMESSASLWLVRDSETLLAAASSVAPAQSRRGAGTPRSKGGRPSLEG